MPHELSRRGFGKAVAFGIAAALWPFGCRPKESSYPTPATVPTLDSTLPSVENGSVLNPETGELAALNPALNPPDYLPSSTRGATPLEQVPGGLHTKMSVQSYASIAFLLAAEQPGTAIAGSTQQELLSHETTTILDAFAQRAGIEIVQVWDGGDEVASVMIGTNEQGQEVVFWLREQDGAFSSRPDRLPSNNPASVRFAKIALPQGTHAQFQWGEDGHLYLFAQGEGVPRRWFAPSYANGTSPEGIAQGWVLDRGEVEVLHLIEGDTGGMYETMRMGLEDTTNNKQYEITIAVHEMFGVRLNGAVPANIEELVRRRGINIHEAGDGIVPVLVEIRPITAYHEEEHGKRLIQRLGSSYIALSPEIRVINGRQTIVTTQFVSDGLMRHAIDHEYPLIGNVVMDTFTDFVLGGLAITTQDIVQQANTDPTRGTRPLYDLMFEFVDGYILDEHLDLSGAHFNASGDIEDATGIIIAYQDEKGDYWDARTGVLMLTRQQLIEKVADFYNNGGVLVELDS